MNRLGWIWSISMGALLVPVLAAAQSQFLLFDQPYVVYKIEPYQEHAWFYSELQEYPEMYEFVLTATTTVTTVIMGVEHTSRMPGFSGILVEDQGQAGVREVLRFLANDSRWAIERDSRTQMQYKRGPGFTQELAPGTYRLEISTPDNRGRYSLRFGTERPDIGYFASLREIRAIQDFHGFGWWHMFRTSHVYVPILILMIIVGIGSTYYYARRQRLLS